jgi:hypothetical protein
MLKHGAVRSIRFVLHQGHCVSVTAAADGLAQRFCMFPILVALAWMYVVVLMAAAEATSPDGSVVGAVFTLLMYGVVPLAVTLYLLNTRARRAAKRSAPDNPASAAPNDSSHAPSDAVAPERKVP